MYYALVFFGFVIFPWLKASLGATPNETANPWYYLFFASNFDFIQNGMPDASVLGVLWSIAVEEQFYLVWPIIFFVVPVKQLKYVFATICIGSVLFRFFYNQANFHEMHTLSCIGDMAVGGFGAYLILGEKKFKEWIENLPRWSIVSLYVLVLIIFLFRDEAYTIAAWRPFERILIAFAFLMVLLEQSFSKNSFYKMNSIPFVGKLGRISYGLYCLHFIGILITLTITKKLGLNNSLVGVVFLETILALLLTIAISAISYRLFEGPFLKLKERFSYIIKDV